MFFNLQQRYLPAFTIMTDQPPVRYQLLKHFSDSHPRSKRIPMKYGSSFILALYLLMSSCPAFGQVATPNGRNSTEKVRVVPSAQAAKVGSAVNWAESFEKAQEKATETGKPIFWYVPTLENSFMDRKVEIDRYMKAGMFSWPKIIERLNRDFVPLMAVPNGKQSRAHDLVPYKFVEPGFLVIDPVGKQTLRCDRLTTQHPAWLERLLQSVSPAEPSQEKTMPVDRLLDHAWASFVFGRYDEALERLTLVYAQSTLSRRAWTEPKMLHGMCQFRLGSHEEAKKTWRSLANAYPNEPLGQKAAAEAEGFGPFVRGFEVHTNVVSAINNKQGLSSVTSTAPPGSYSETELWQRGTQFLVGMQRSDGGFVDCDYDFGGTDSLPNVHVAITAICGMALIEAKARKITVPETQRVDSVDLARQFVLDDANWNLNDTDEIFWAHAYRVLFLARSIKNGWNGQAQFQKCVDQLQSIQSRSGSWYHEYPNPLVTALAMVALKEAQSVGARIEPQVITNAVASMNRNRGRGGFLYGDKSITPPKLRGKDLTDSSAGKLPLCEIALYRWDAADDRQLANAVRTSFAKQSHLLASRKYDDHTSRHDYGGFFFWFDLHGRSVAIENLTDAALKAKYQGQLHDLIMKLPEIDGCFVDSHEIGRSYGTAMALLTLANLNDSP